MSTNKILFIIFLIIIGHSSFAQNPHILGLGITNSFFYPNYTSIHRIAASRGGVKSILTMNETAHLRRTGLPVGLA